MNLFSRFLKDEFGATAIEYALIAAVLAIGIIAGLPVLRDSLITTFGNVAETLDNNNAVGATASAPVAP